MQKSTELNWDDVRYVVALARHGSLSATARALGVDHTTVGRRIEAAERGLGARLFTRSQGGYTLTSDGVRLLPRMQEVAAAVHGLSQDAQATETDVAGQIRVTAPETLGMTWLTAELCPFLREHPAVTVVMDPSGTVADLGRGEAEVALRTVRSRAQRLIVRHVADVAYGLYASPTYLQQHPVTADLSDHRFLAPPEQPSSSESRWLARLAPGVRPVLVSELSVTLQVAAGADAGIAVLPRFLGDASTGLVHLPRPDEPTEALWLTVHEDARAIPRVRALVDFLGAVFRDRGSALRGR